MTSPKQRVLEAVRGSGYPLTRSSLLDRLEAAEVDVDVVAAAAALGTIEFTDVDELGDALDMAFGMPDASAGDSVLEAEGAHFGVALPPDAPAVAGESISSFGEISDLTVASLRSVLADLDGETLLRIELEDADVSETLVPIAVRADERTGIVVLEVARLNSA